MDRANNMLESLENLRLLSEVLKTNIQEDKEQAVRDMNLVVQSTEKISANIVEAKICKKFLKMWDTVKNENVGLHAKLKEMADENSWLQEKLTDTNDKLVKTEESMIELEGQKKAIEFEQSLLLFQKDLTERLSEEEFVTSVNEVVEMLGDSDAKPILTDDDSTKECGEAEDKLFDCLKSMDTFGNEVPLNNKSQTDSSSNTSSVESVNITDSVMNPGARSTPLSLSTTSSASDVVNLMVPICEEALQQLAELHGDEHPDIAAVLAVLSLIYRDRKDEKQAVNLMVEANRMREKLLGTAHPIVIESLHNLEATFRAAGKFKEAIAVCKQLLSIARQKFGAGHPESALVLIQLAYNCCKEKNYRKAQKYFSKAANVLQSRLGMHHAAVLNVKYKLAKSYRKSGEYMEAQKTLTDVALKVHEVMMDSSYENETVAGDWDKLEGPKFSVVLSSLCEIYRLQGKSKNALALEKWVKEGMPTGRFVAPIDDNEFNVNIKFLIKVALILLGFYLFA